uniref:Uncharacterized protein n=1 Tax=Anguilla anguilla TaxID=7936 RepID=A0A0E9TJ61_ANGAN
MLQKYAHSLIMQYNSKEGVSPSHTVSAAGVS